MRRHHGPVSEAGPCPPTSLLLGDRVRPGHFSAGKDGPRVIGTSAGFGGRGRISTGRTQSRLGIMASVMAESVVELPGSPASWEERCEERLSRRPFRVIGWDEGGPEGRSFVVEYRNLAGVVLALVYIDIEPSKDGATTVRLRSDGVADNPLRMLFRDIGEKASRKALARLRDDA